MGGFVWAVRSGLVWPPFDPGAAARYYDFMPYILHLPWKEEVLVDAPKRSVYQLSLWLSCHIPPRCRWSVPGPQYARTSPKTNSRKFTVASGSSTQWQALDNRPWCSSPAPKRGDLVAVVAPMCIKWFRLVTMQLPEKFSPIGLGTNRSSHIRLSRKFAETRMLGVNLSVGHPGPF